MSALDYFNRQSRPGGLMGWVILTLAALLGNACNLPLFFGVDFLFGSIAVLLVSCLYGPVWGVASALISSSYTILLWNHPLAIATFGLEAAVVGTLYHRRTDNLILLDGLFWVFLGAPLGWFLYSKGLGVEETGVWLVVLKQIINGIFNALCAQILLTVVPWWRGSAEAEGRLAQLSLRDAVFILVSSLIFLPTLLLTVSDSRREFRRIETSIKDDLQATSENLAVNLGIWYRQHWNAVRELAQDARAIGIESSGELQEKTELIQRAFPHFHGVCIAGADGSLVACSPNAEGNAAFILGPTLSKRPYFQQLREKGEPLMSDVFQGESGLGVPTQSMSMPIQSGNQLIGFAEAALKLDEMDEWLQEQMAGKSVEVILLDTQRRVVASSLEDLSPMQVWPEVGDEETHTLRDRGEAASGSNLDQTSMAKWKHAYFAQENPVEEETPLTLAVRTPLAGYQQELYLAYIQSFSVTAGMALLGFLVAGIISSRFSQPLVRLSRLTSDVPETVSQGQPLDWPRSRIGEVNSLIHNFQSMIRNLQQSWGEVQRHAGRLESEIAERRQAEQALRQSEERYRMLFEHHPYPMMLFDIQTFEFLGVNQAAIEHYGYSREEFLSMTIKDIRPPEDIPRMLAHPVFRSAGTHELGIWRHRKKDGTIMPMEITSHQVEVGGRATRLSLCIDVSDRLQAEARLREQAHLLDQVQDAIVVLDLESRIQFWNKAAESLYGWTADEAGSRIFPDLLQVDRQVYEEALQTSLEKGESTGEFRHYDRNGREIIVDSRWTLLRAEEGNPKAILAVNTDVTEKKQLETQLLRAQRLESIGTLASGIAHDLNNILLPILMSAQMLRIRWRNEQAQPLLDRIETNAQRGAEVIKQVLTFARGIEGERVILQPRYLLQEMEKIGSETFPRKIGISLHLNRDLWPIKGDATQLHQVLLNLCVNARDAMRQGGKLTLSAENVHLDAEYASQFPDAMPGPYVRMEVCDTGLGIPESVLDNIFDPFFTTKSQGHGTGLGLSTVLGIVRSHGGFIKVESREAQGTAFKIYLPALPGADLTAVVQPSSVPMRQGEGECILVVDDEEDVRQVAEDILGSNGYRVLLASDGYEALEILGEQADQIDLMVTDIMMPNMDGALLVRSLRDWSSRIKVIVASGLGYPEQVSELKTMGIQHFLSKPFSARKLLNVIHEALHSPAAP